MTRGIVFTVVRTQPSPPPYTNIGLLDCAARVSFSSEASRDGRELVVEVPCKGLDWRLSSLEQVCTSCLPPLSMLEYLFYFYDDSHGDWKDDIDNAPWVELLRPFSTVKNLYLAKKVAPPLHLPSKSSLGAVRQRCCPQFFPLCKKFLWKSQSHRDLCRKGFDSSLLRDRSPVTL
jgi:hypothetical protein